MISRAPSRASWLGALLLLLLAGGPAYAQTGSIVGVVTDQEGTALAGAQVTLEGTGFGNVTGADGRYSIPNVSPGTYNVVVRMLGYALARQANVVVVSGQAASADFRLRTEALRLQEVIVTGVADPVEGIRMPFSVSRVSRESLPVPQSNMAAAIRGRVAGARVVSSSGMPGSGMDIRLRSRLGVNTSDAPLMVVDGVIQGANILDLDAADIESIEVLKGAAASSMYGSRAQAGVLEITTRRGQEVGVGQTRITARSEYGRSFLGDVPATASHHPYQTDAEGYFIDADGNRITELEDRVNRVLREDRMVASPYRGPLYNHLDLFFDPGRFTNSTVTVAQNTQSTNFFASFGDFREGGVAPDFNKGYHRQNVRFNLDHRVRSDLTVGFTTYHSQSSQNSLTGGNPFYDLRFIAPDIDLTTPNPDGQPYLIQPDPTQNQNSPLYALWAEDAWNYRNRTQASANIRYNPFSWLNLDGLFSFDRSDRERHRVRPQDFLTADPDQTLDGIVDRTHNFSEATNGHLQATLIRSFGDLTARTRFRYNFQTEEGSGFGGRGTGFIVSGVPTLNNMQETLSCQPGGGSVCGNGTPWTQVNQEGIMVNTGLDYRGKYIGDFLVRRDVSSLFGPQNRWHTYFRASASYLMSEEDWWPFESVTAFKPRFSIGTAGSRPGFLWQYETWSLGAAGISKGTLGNRDLAPELTTERDFGLDFIIKDRFSVELTYATATVDDQLVPVPLPSFFGYGSQWQNAGQVKSKAYEATLEAALVQSATLGWNMGLVADRAKSWLSDWQRTCYRASGGGIFYRCQGESFSTMRMRTWMTSHDHLPSQHSGSHSQFQVNDEGYLVPVGSHNWTDGIAQDLWGTTVTIDGVEYPWGRPLLIRGEDGLVDDLYIAGDANPKFNLGWTNSVRWRGFNFFTLVDAKIGGDVYNNTRQWPYRDNMHLDQVQAGKPPERMKPLDYYQTLYATNANNSHFVEDGTFVKLREVQVGYRLNRDQLQRVFAPIAGLGMESMSFNLIGRNIFTITNYSEIDPEVGSGGGGGPTENPFDGFSYPNFRSFTFSVEVQF